MNLGFARGGRTLGRSISEAAGGEVRRLLAIFAFNGIAYLPMMTLPWFVSGLSADLGLSATQAGFVGTVLLGVIALTTGGAALCLAVQRAWAAGLLGAALALAALGAALAIPGRPAMPVLLLAGVGFGISAASANVLIATARDPVRLNGGLWFLTVLWQLPIWAGTPLLAAHAPLWGVIVAQGLGGIVLALIALAAGAPQVAPVSTARDAADAPPSAWPTGLVLLVGVIAFWLRDGITWSLVDRRAALLGVAPGTLALTLTLTSLIALAGPALAMVLGERFGRLRTVVAVQTLAGLLLFAIAIAWQPALYCGALLLWSGISVLAWTYMMGLAAVADATGRIAAACGSVLFAASAIGPVAGGLLIDRRPQSLPTVILALGLVAIAACWYAAGRLPGGSGEGRGSERRL